jgi:glycosyltransferase involved in cell wall biosynthesis
MDIKKVSIVIPVLNSHEILRRQFLHFENIGIPDDVEIIIVDDGSEPPLQYAGNLPVRIIATNDKRPWTWALARNRGAKEARGEYLMMFDLDHIISKECLDMARKLTHKKMCFKREFGVLLDDGTFSQDLETLVLYGFPRDRYPSRGLALTALPNNFVMKKDVFMEIGGYREDLFTRPYPQGEDRLFKKRWLERERATGEFPCLERPTIYMFPNGYLCGDVDYNPFGLLHNLTRKTSRNPKYLEE